MTDHLNHGLPEDVKVPGLPVDAQNPHITPFFKHMSVFDVAQSENGGKPVYELMEVVELRLAGDRNYAPVMPADAMSFKIGNRVVTYAERWADQYRAFIAGDDQKATGTALEMLADYGVTPAQLSICRALKIYSIEALHGLGPNETKNLGLNANALKQMAARFMADRERTGDVRDNVIELKAEIERLRSMIPAEQTAPDDIDQLVEDADRAQAAQAAASEASSDAFEGMADDELKAFIADKTGARPRGQPNHDTLVKMAREVAEAAPETA